MLNTRLGLVRCAGGSDAFVDQVDRVCRRRQWAERPVGLRPCLAVIVAAHVADRLMQAANLLAAIAPQAHVEAGRHMQRPMSWSPRHCVVIAGVDLVSLLLGDQQPPMLPLFAGRLGIEIHALPASVMATGKVHRVIRSADQQRIRRMAKCLGLVPLRRITWPDAAAILQARVMAADDGVQVTLAVHGDGRPRVIVASLPQGIDRRPFYRRVIQRADASEIASFVRFLHTIWVLPANVTSLLPLPDVARSLPMLEMS